MNYDPYTINTMLSVDKRR